MSELPDRRTLVAHAPAKVNLFLELLERRPDGYHELETVMVAVGLWDTLYFEPTDDGQLRFTLDSLPAGGIRRVPGQSSTNLHTTDGKFSERRAETPADETNIVVRSLAQLRQQTGIQKGARVRLVKRIPVQAGLGGASSDAAAALGLANVGWRLGWSAERLRRFAGLMGSDVPFFVGGSAAVCRGRGEIIEPLNVRPRLHLVIVKPPVGLSTPRVFAQCQVPSRPRSPQPMVAAIERGSLRAIVRCLHNRLEPAASALTEWMDRLRRHFERVGCPGHLMSGSGSCYFGVFHHRDQARRAANLLRTRCVGTVMLTRTV